MLAKLLPFHFWLLQLLQGWKKLDTIFFVQEKGDSFNMIRCNGERLWTKGAKWLGISTHINHERTIKNVDSNQLLRRALKINLESLLLVTTPWKCKLLRGEFFRGPFQRQVWVPYWCDLCRLIFKHRIIF